MPTVETRLEATTTEGGVCANLGPRERRRLPASGDAIAAQPATDPELAGRRPGTRNVVGVAGALMTVLTAAALIDSHASWLVRLVIVLPGMLAAMGFLQARLLENEPERVTDDGISRRIAAQARKVYVQATVAVAALTLLVMAIP